MKERCPKCGLHEPPAESIDVFRHAAATLGWPIQVIRRYACASCGREFGMQHSHQPGSPNRLVHAQGPGNDSRNQVEVMHAHIAMVDELKGKIAAVQYPAVCLAATRDVLATGEATIQDATTVDRYGDPELMAAFGEQYLSAYQAIMPSGRLPESVVEMMPALHLLRVAVELFMKADLIRSEQDPGNEHSLERLYKKLDVSHRNDTERRFCGCDPNARLRAVGHAPLTVPDVLAVYDRSYGGASTVYEDTRYLAEPTTKLKKTSAHIGANLLKSQTPYPIFLPHVAESLLETFRFYDGAARLKRLGADVALGARAKVANNHGEWGLVPRSLGMVAVQIPQSARLSIDGEELPEFGRWKHQRQPEYSTSWKYGGNALLFYSAGENSWCDNERNIDGIDCRLWFNERLGMHSRDLYGLADALESEGAWNTFLV